MKTCLAFFLAASIVWAADPAASRATDAKAAAALQSLDGAWRLKADPNRIMLVMDGYFSDAAFDPALKQLTRAFGGPFTFSGGISRGKFDFDSSDAQRVGREFSVPVRVSGDELIIGTDNQNETWTRVDRNAGELGGVWRLTGREIKGALAAIPPGAQRTLKILTGTRFQWITLNVETGEFGGTGGGTYTFKDGKYTEQLEYYSRDPARAGTSLTFEGELKGRGWHQRGKDSQGEPLHEVWTRL